MVTCTYGVVVTVVASGDDHVPDARAKNAGYIDRGDYGFLYLRCRIGTDRSKGSYVGSDPLSYLHSFHYFFCPPFEPRHRRVVSATQWLRFVIILGGFEAVKMQCEVTQAKCTFAPNKRGLSFRSSYLICSFCSIETVP
jgi:hypothetical protein